MVDDAAIDKDLNEFFDQGQPEVSTDETTPKADEPTESATQEAAPVGESTESTEEQRQPQTVPLPELLSERKKRQELEHQIEQFRGLQDEIREYRESQRQQQQPTEQSPTKPDYYEDPLGYIKTLEDQINKLSGTIGDTRSQLSQQDELQQQVSVINSQISQFVAQTPDFAEADQYVRDRQIQALQLAGYNEQQIAETMRQNDISTGRALLQNKVSYPEYIYGVAKSFGYQPKTNGTTPESTATPADTGKEQLASVEKGQQRQAGGKQGGRAADMTDMSDDEFEQAMKETFGNVKWY